MNELGSSLALTSSSHSALCVVRSAFGMNGPDGRWIIIQMGVSGKEIKITRLEPSATYRGLKHRISREYLLGCPEDWSQHLYIPQRLDNWRLEDDRECYDWRQVFSENDCGGRLVLLVCKTQDQIEDKEARRKRGEFARDLMEMD